MIVFMWRGGGGNENDCKKKVEKKKYLHLTFCYSESIPAVMDSIFWPLIRDRL